MRKWVLILLGIGLLLPFSSLAQEPLALTETYTTQDGSLTLQYPRGWVVQDFNGLVFMGNSDAALAGEISPGSIGVFLSRLNTFMDFAGPLEAGETLEMSAATTPQALLEMAGLNEDEIQVGLWQETREYAYTSLDAGDAEAESFIYVMMTPAGEPVLLYGLTLMGEWAAAEPTLLAILASVEAEPLPAATAEPALEGRAYTFDMAPLEMIIPFGWEAIASVDSTTLFAAFDNPLTQQRERINLVVSVIALADLENGAETDLAAYTAAPLAWGDNLPEGELVEPAAIGVGEWSGWIAYLFAPSSNALSLVINVADTYLVTILGVHPDQQTVQGIGPVLPQVFATLALVEA